MKWRELDEDKIYKIVNFKFINTSYGKACIITLSNASPLGVKSNPDGCQVYAPSTLFKRLENADPEEVLPAYIKPNGKTISKKTGNKYFDYDLVLNNE
jgi:hypothetical protein